MLAPIFLYLGTGLLLLGLRWQVLGIASMAAPQLLIKGLVAQYVETTYS